MKFGTLMGAAALALTLVTGSAQADILFGPAAGGPWDIPGSVSTGGFNAGAGAGAATFQLDGYNTVDGDGNCCTDVFTLNLNGSDIFSGAFNLGGGGNNVVYFAPVGTTTNVVSGGFNQGGFVSIFVPLALIEGINTLTLSYSGGGQGLADEAWGASNFIVTGNAPGAVPEPATWALMIGGFGMAGSMIRRRRSLAA